MFLMLKVEIFFVLWFVRFLWMWSDLNRESEDV